jgi:hypothetical protein
VTAAQRLRLVVALGVVNLVLAGVALGFGIVGLPAEKQIAAGPTPPTAIAQPTPPGPSATARPEPSPRPTPTPIATPPSGQPPAGTPPPTPIATPPPTPTATPTPTPTEPAQASGPTTLPTTGTGGVVVVFHPPTPKPPSPEPVHEAGGPPTCTATTDHRVSADRRMTAVLMTFAPVAGDCPKLDGAKPPTTHEPPKTHKPPKTHDRPPPAHGPKPGHDHHKPPHPKPRPPSHHHGHHHGPPARHHSSG